MPGNRKGKLLQHITFISNLSDHSNVFKQAGQYATICRWRLDQLFAINDMRDSDNHSITKVVFMIVKSHSDS